MNLDTEISRAFNELKLSSLLHQCHFEETKRVSLRSSALCFGVASVSELAAFPVMDNQISGKF